MVTHKEAMAAYERRLIENTLERTGGDVRAAARALDMPERTLWYKIKTTHGIKPDAYRVFNATRRAIAIK